MDYKESIAWQKGWGKGFQAGKESVEEEIKILEFEVQELKTIVSEAAANRYKELYLGFRRCKCGKVFGVPKGVKLPCNTCDGSDEEQSK